MLVPIRFVLKISRDGTGLRVLFKSDFPKITRKGLGERQLVRDYVQSHVEFVATSWSPDSQTRQKLGVAMWASKFTLIT